VSVAATAVEVSYDVGKAGIKGAYAVGELAYAAAQASAASTAATQPASSATPAEH
jgi:hypothetical protein